MDVEREGGEMEVVGEGLDSFAQQRYWWYGKRVLHRENLKVGVESVVEVGLLLESVAGAARQRYRHLSSILVCTDARQSICR